MKINKYAFIVLTVSVILTGNNSFSMSGIRNDSITPEGNSVKNKELFYRQNSDEKMEQKKSKIVNLILGLAKKLVEIYKAGLDGKNFKNKKPIISIAGGSSVGKSYFSEKLMKKLAKNGIRAKVLPLDIFLDRTSKLGYNLEPSEFNHRVGTKMWPFDNREAQRVFQEIEAGKPIIKEPYFNFETRVKCFSDTDYSKVDLVIAEGIYALSGPDTYNLAMYSSLKIFLDAGKKRLLSWYCERKKSRGHPYPEKDPVTAWDFEEDYEKVIAPTKKNADLIIEQDENRNYY